MQALMTKTLQAKTPNLYETDGQGKHAIAQAHYFSCIGGLAGFDWYMTEYDPETREAFGLVYGHYGFELGYFSLNEFDQLNQQFGFEVIERDTHFDPMPLYKIY